MQRPPGPSRPHLIKAAIFGVLALAGMVVASFGQVVKEQSDRDITNTDIVVAAIGAGVTLLAGALAVRSLAAAVRAVIEQRIEESRRAPLGTVISIVGYVVLLLSILGVLNVPIGGLLLGGAVTGVIVGIAAQQTLGNFFAGLVLLFVRPFSLGDRIVLRSGPLGGEYEGLVTSMGLFYVDLVTDRGPVALPNAGVLASAIGPGARSQTEEPRIEEEPAP